MAPTREAPDVWARLADEGAAGLWARLVLLHHLSEDKPLERAMTAERALADTDCVRNLLREARNAAIRDAAEQGHTTPVIMRATGLSRSQVEKVRHSGGKR